MTGLALISQWLVNLKLLYAHSLIHKTYWKKENHLQIFQIKSLLH